MDTMTVLMRDLIEQRKMSVLNKMVRTLTVVLFTLAFACSILFAYTSQPFARKTIQEYQVSDKIEPDIPFLSIWIIINFISRYMQSFVITHDMQILAATNTFFSYLMVGIPAVCYMVFAHNMALKGLIWGNIAAAFVECCLNIYAHA
jgi:Na+-driven multidrug efflux pump